MAMNSDEKSTVRLAFEEQQENSMGANLFVVQPEYKRIAATPMPIASPSPQQNEKRPKAFFRIIRSLWATRQTEKNIRNNKERYVQVTLRELIIYLFFVTVLCIISLGMTSTKTFFLTSSVRSKLTQRRVEGIGDHPTFDEIITIAHFWEVIEGPVLDGLFEDQANQNQSGYVLSENKLLGRARLRQLRVKNNSCMIHKKFSEKIDDCYATYRSSVEDHSNFPVANSSSIANALVYKTARQLDGSSVSAKIHRYNGGGYALDLSNDYNIAREQIKELKQLGWVDRGTRVIFLDFTLYNGNVNLFCHVQLIVELPATGGVVTSRYFSTVKLIRYVSTMDYFVLACEILYIIFTLYYTIEEILEIKLYRRSYFKQLWNILDVLILAISYVCIAFNIYRHIKIEQILDGLLENNDRHPQFGFLVYWQVQYDNVVAFAVFLTWIKIFKYVSFNKTMAQLSATLTRCAEDILGFSVMFMIVFLAYAQLAYLLFGTMVADYQNFSYSIFSLFRIILGDFDFHAIIQAHQTLGPIFFITYVFFVFFILLNMFLAIINDTYSSVKRDMANQRSEFKLLEYVKNSYEKMLQRWKIKQNRVIDIRDALQSSDINKNGKIEFREWRQTLKARGYTDSEIEVIFSRYDSDGDQVLCKKEQHRFQMDLIAEQMNIKQEILSLEKKKENKDSFDLNNFDRMQFMDIPDMENRIVQMESSVSNAVLRIDAILARFDVLISRKTEQQKFLNTTLQTICENPLLTPDMKQQQLEMVIRQALENEDAKVYAEENNEIVEEIK